MADTDQASELLDLYEQMVVIRLTEQATHDLFLSGLVKGTTHLAAGHEAVAVGASAALAPGRLRVRHVSRPPPRDGARRQTAEECLAELMSKATGLCKAKGGSMHLTKADRGMLGSYAIVGSHLPMAVGAAWSATLRGTEQIAVAFFGDGATNIGAFHEALNLAAVWRLPVLFVCENNLYMEYTPIASVTAVTNPAADRAAAYGIPAELIDGNDVLAVRDTVAAAADRARSGRRPDDHRGPHVPPLRAQPDRSRHLPPGGGARVVARTRPARPGPDPARRARCGQGADRGRRRAGGTARCRCRRRGEGRPARRSGRCAHRCVGRRRSVMADVATRPTITYREAVAEGIAREMRRDDTVVCLGEDIGAAEGVFKTTVGLFKEFGPRRVLGHADLGAGDRRCGDGCGDDRTAPGGRDHVLRLPRLLLGLPGQRDPEGSLHDGRSGDGAARHPHGQRRRTRLRRPAFAGDGELGVHHPRSEDRRAVDARPTSSD